MAYLFSDLQAEVARRGTRNQAGDTFTVAIKNLINTSLFHVAREANWKQLRRQAQFNTVAQYSTGTISATNASASFTGSSLSWLTAGVQPGRKLTIQGSNLQYTVLTITGQNSFTTDYTYDGTTASGLTYVLYGQESYSLPIQTNKEAIIWHNKFGFPYKLRYLTTNEFYSSSVNPLVSYTSTHYSMWENMIINNQVLAPSVVSVVSSSASDTSQSITVFGTVSGLPDSESILLTGTSTAVGTKTFSQVERVTKNASTIGYITVTANSGNCTVVQIPTGYQTDSVPYKRIKLFPLPDSVFPINVYFYKQPFRLVNDDDIHELGQDFDEAIILHATAKVKLEDNIEEGKYFAQLYTDEIKNLKTFNVDKLDWLPTLLRPDGRSFNSNRMNRFLSYSNLGGNYGPAS